MKIANGFTSFFCYFTAALIVVAMYYNVNQDLSLFKRQLHHGIESLFFYVGWAVAGPIKINVGWVASFCAGPINLKKTFV
ncbi:membrane protein [Beggiatoa sp. SS]|nr:membrane protein [Beggiatoa sp. SS]